MDRAVLLEIENAVLRVVVQHQSILRPEALEAMLDVLRRYLSFEHGL